MTSRPADRLRFVLLALLVGFASSQAVVLAQTAKSLTRKHQPAVRYAGKVENTSREVPGLRLEAPFLGGPIDQIAAYRYAASTDTWVQVPFQIDQRAYRDFGVFLVCDEATQQPDCACQEPPTCADLGIVCEESFIWDGESDPDDTPSGNLLDDNDQIVFMVADSGDKAPATSWPNLQGALDTRYELEVSTALGTEGKGWVYLYRFDSAVSWGQPYMSYTRSPANPPPTDPRATLTETSITADCNHPNLDAEHTYRVDIRGNWIWHGLRAVPPKNGGTCVDPASRNDVLDRFKVDMGVLSEQVFNVKSSHVGIRSGPVRVVKAGLGARSGYGTTHYYLAYPTYFDETIHLRVHVLTHNIVARPDFLRVSANIPPTPPCPGSDFQIHQDRSPTFFDHVDGWGGACIAATQGAWNVPRQFNGAHASIASYVMEDPDHPIPVTGAGHASFYGDDFSASEENEDDAGAYGNFGSQWVQPSETEESGCPNYPLQPGDPNIKYGVIRHVWQVESSGSGVTRAVQLDRNELKSPIVVTSTRQARYSANPPPTSPCVPTINAVNPSIGFALDLTVSSPCGTSGLNFRVFRAGASGPFSLLRDLGDRLSVRDFAVARGETYRYYAVSYNPEGTTSTSSTIATVSVTDTTPPSVPVISGSVSGNQVLLDWAHVGDFDLSGYNVYRAANPGGPYTKLTLGGPVRPANYSAHLPLVSTPYYFVVKSVDLGGLESAASNELTFVGE